MKLERLGWHEIAPYIERATGEDAALIAAEVQAEQAEAWRVVVGRDCRAHMVLRWEHRSGGTELVVVALEGRGLKELAPEIIRQAQAVGAVSVRYHTARRGMQHMLQGLGFREVERVYRVELWAADQKADQVQAQQ